MKRIIKLLFYFFTLIVPELFGQAYHSSVDMRVTFTPQPVIIHGKRTVYYELHLTSFSTDSIVLKKLEVIGASDSSVILLMSDAALKKGFGRTVDYGNNVLAPGASGVIYIECILPGVGDEISVFHRLDVEKVQSGKKQSFAVKGAGMLIKGKQVTVLGPPLKEGPWAAIYDPSWERGHRRVFYTVDGNARIRGRFAIDFIKLNSQGQYARGDNDLILNWIGYNDDILAVADGVVASVRNDFKESLTLKDHPAYPAEKASGNYIAIDIGKDLVVFYEHLKPGSIKVMPGQRVRKGETIASLGFTGQTTGPHLHFHVADKNAPLGAEGIPFVFEHFMLLGAYSDLEKFGIEPWISEKKSPQVRSGERPSPNSVIKFKP
ncbi:MAG: hypothetical protein C0490_04785 [Marivirga sp.]|nr:hypothetical protein [Marivirga sp.]